MLTLANNRFLCAHAIMEVNESVKDKKRKSLWNAVCWLLSRTACREHIESTMLWLSTIHAIAIDVIIILWWKPIRWLYSRWFDDLWAVRVLERFAVTIGNSWRFWSQPTFTNQMNLPIPSIGCCSSSAKAILHRSDGKFIILYLFPFQRIAAVWNGLAVCPY